MASFFVHSGVLRAQALAAGESGFVGADAAIEGPAGRAAVTMSGGRLNVLGVVAGHGTRAAPSPFAVRASGAVSIALGEDGAILGGASAGVRQTGGTLKLRSAGLIDAALVGVAVEGAGAEILNRGDVVGGTTGIAAGLSSALVLANAGAIEGGRTGVLSDGRGGEDIDNAGRIFGAVAALNLGAGASTVRNTGDLAGAVLLGGGADLFDGTLGRQGRVVGGDGADTIRGGAGDERLEGGGGADALAGRGGDDVLVGGAEADRMDGGAGDDTLRGDAGADTLTGGAGADALDGGEGADLVRYGGSPSKVEIDLETGEGVGGDADGDTLSGVEHVEGTPFADTLTGDAAANRLNGRGASDLVIGGAGDDTIEGGAGDDSLFGGEGFDILSFRGATEAISNGVAGFGSGAYGAGFDAVSGFEGIEGGRFADLLLARLTEPTALFGLGGADTLLGGQSLDTLSGGAGDDAISGGFSNDALSGDEGRDALQGGDGDDLLDGGADGDNLRGDGGNDTLRGGAGDDVLIGGRDVDSLDGGAGNDTFAFVVDGGAVDSGPEASDRIAGFDGAGAAAGDRIDLSGIDARPDLPGDSAFVFDGASGPGRIVLSSIGDVTSVRGFIDGDFLADFRILIEDGATPHTAYTADDFSL